MSNELELTDKNKELSLQYGDVTDRVKGYMESKEKKVFFNGKRYPEVDDSIFAASFLGYKASTKDTVPVEIGEQKGFKSSAIVVDRAGTMVGSADAYCLDGEPNWARKPLFQLAGMAQTRAVNRALLNILKPFFRLAGVEATPAEEMMEDKPPVAMPKPKTTYQDAIEVQIPSQAPAVDPRTQHKVGPISDKQNKLLFAKSRAAGISHEDFKAYLSKTFGIEHTKDLPWTKMQDVIKWIDSQQAASEIPFGANG